MQFIKRVHGQEQPYWPAGPFKIRLPFIHYRWELPEMIQGFFMFVVGLAMIPLLESYLGMPYEAALAFTFIAGIGYILPALLGVPLVPGWITPAIPVVLLYLKGFEPGPEAIRALFALQIEVSIIFLILGATRLGSKLVDVIPNSLKCGIIIGAGMAAMMGELKVGGRIDSTPISLIVGSIISAYILFSLSFKNVINENSLARRIANFGMVPGMIIAMLVGWTVGEYPLPEIKWGITNPDFSLMWQYLPFTVGYPNWEVFLLAIPTALIAYVIAFGDILVGFTLVNRVDHIRDDEKIEENVDRVHLVTAIRNGFHAFLAPWPGLAGPLWTAAHATVAERYAMGRKSMESIYSGGGTFWMSGLLALLALPLVTLFKPVLPIALSLTLVLTAYICIMVGMEQLKSSTERGVAGIVAVTLAMPDPKSTMYAVCIGIILYFLIERPRLMGKHNSKDNIIFADGEQKEVALSTGNKTLKQGEIQMSTINIFEQYLDPNEANYMALTPISFLERAAFVYPDKIATINGNIRHTWLEVFQRCTRFASALAKRGITRGDTVSIIAPNISEHFEVHFGVPMSGAVLNSINTRLDAEAIAFILVHAETKVLITDKEFSPVVKKALRMIPHKPLVIDIDDPHFNEGQLIGSVTYEELLNEGDSNYQPLRPVNEWDAISLNYTSGTTGDPKGVVYHYRGAYLNAVSNVMSWGMTEHPVYLWTLPMFHCNGWCFPWSIAATAGTSVSLRHVRAEPIFDLIKTEKVGYFCGAPIVLNMLNGANASLKAGINHTVKVMTAGAPPPASVIEGMEESGFSVTHTYGLTETYGPSVVCAWNDKWNKEDAEQQARLKSRQGVRSPMLDQLMVADPETLVPMPKDGKSIGEIFMRGNLVMKGYLKNPSTTQSAFEGGWLHSGDIAVWHSDGYIEIKDRSKDVIISGGENISSVEVEDILYRHPKIQEVAVVAKKDNKWGETPCAFITPMPNTDLTEEEIISFCRDNMAHFKTPKTFVFGELPKTSTGKIQKYVLRKQANEQVNKTLPNSSDSTISFHYYFWASFLLALFL